MKAHLRFRNAVAALCFAAGTITAPAVHAQVTSGFTDRAEQMGPLRIPSFGRSVATVDDSTALVSNPANLVMVPGGELRWQGVYLRDDAALPYKGHAVGFAVPVPSVGLGFGMRGDFLNPPGDNASQISDRYNWLTWGLALGSEMGSVGVSLQRSYSNDALAHALVSWTAGLSLRPWNPIALAVVASHFNAPVNEFEGTIDRSFDFGMAVRPLGTEDLEVGLETRLVDPALAEQFWVPRATLGVSVPRVGRLHGDIAVSDLREQIGDRAWLASVGLAVNLNGARAATELGGGTLVGDRLGETAKNQAHENAYSEVALKFYRNPTGIERPRFAVRIRIESTPGPREHVALLRELWRIAEYERSVDAVVLELRDDPAKSSAHTQELRDAIRYLRLHGKRVICHLEESEGRALYACSAADRVLINPAGGIRFAGLKSRRFYYSQLLENLGIHADFVRIGDHKSAPESWTRDGGTDVARADRIGLMQQFERYYAGGIATGRGIEVEQLRERIATGPFTAKEAKAAGLVDAFAFDDQVEEATQDVLGRPTRLVKQKEITPRADSRFGVGPRVALVYADGNIVDGRSRTVPFLGMHTIGSYSFAETLQKVREDDMTKAVVLRIDSPGGSAMASDVIWREVHLLAKAKPVIVSMGAVAASGGYYIAVPAKRIYANPLTITGSIGIYYGKADVAVLMKRLGVSSEVVKTTPRADAHDIFRPYTDAEREGLKDKIEQYYDIFLDRVAHGRALSKEEVDAVGQGRVWTGEQAVEKGLVDEVGGLRQALDYARQVAHLPRHAPIVELPPPDSSLLGKVLGVEGVQSRATDLLPAELLQMVSAAAPFMLYSADEPMALMELVEIGP
jgi:protease-4